MNEKLMLLAQKLVDKKEAEEAIITKYKDKEKVKALTTAERIARIEELLGIE